MIVANFRTGNEDGYGDGGKAGATKLSIDANAFYTELFSIKNKHEML